MALSKASSNQQKIGTNRRTNEPDLQTLFDHLRKQTVTIGTPILTDVTISENTALIKLNYV